LLVVLKELGHLLCVLLVELEDLEVGEVEEFLFEAVLEYTADGFVTFLDLRVVLFQFCGQFLDVCEIRVVLGQLLPELLDK
jgi:hypothetical protein